jgi:hypothetical protein
MKIPPIKFAIDRDIMFTVTRKIVNDSKLLDKVPRYDLYNSLTHFFK